MELKNEFEVTVPLGDAWDILTDVERIAPCLPGAELREVDGDEYRGVVKVKLGPISAEYRGAGALRGAQRRRAPSCSPGRGSGGTGPRKCQGHDHGGTGSVARRNKGLRNNRLADHGKSRPVRTRSAGGRLQQPLGPIRAQPRADGDRRAEWVDHGSEERHCGTCRGPRHSFPAAVGREPARPTG